MTVLYRKYRPQAFGEVVGQEHVKATLLQEVASDRLAHSYLFTGPRGVGKTTMARLLAKAVNCPARAPGRGEPCGICDICKEIAEGRSLDVVEIDAASHTGVENVREQIIELARFAPSKSRFKVFIIDEVHMLSTSAFNALLKTLEEPPAHALFIMATTELQKLPATVVSRCQRFDFRKIALADLIARLKRLADEEGVLVAPEVLEAVARQGDGCLRDAESLLTQLLALGEKNVTSEVAELVLPARASETVAEMAEALSRRDAGAALAAWQRLTESGADPARAVADLTELIRLAAFSTLRAAAGRAEAAAGTLRALLDPRTGADLLQRLVRARDEMRRSEIPELPIELMTVEWCHEGASQEPSAFAGATADKKVESQNIRNDRRNPSDGPGASAGGAPPHVEAEPVAAPLASAAPPRAAEAAGTAPAKNHVSIETIRGHWQDILKKSQEKNHGLPYMLGAAELLGSHQGELTLGFQYALYRDRLNELKFRRLFEAALSEVVGSSMTAKSVLVAQRMDGAAEAAPRVVVTPEAKLPDGFKELVREFGGTIVG